MILADTSAWLRLNIHRKEPEAAFARLVVDGTIVGHPWVVGELALGGARPLTLALLGNLPMLPLASIEDVMAFIRRYRPTGIGWVDVNLLVAAVDADARILTFDADLHRNAGLHGRALE